MVFKIPGATPAAPAKPPVQSPAEGSTTQQVLPTSEQADEMPGERFMRKPAVLVAPNGFTVHAGEQLSFAGGKLYFLGAVVAAPPDALPKAPLALKDDERALVGDMLAFVAAETAKDLAARQESKNSPQFAGCAWEELDRFLLARGVGDDSLIDRLIDSGYLVERVLGRLTVGREWP